MISLVSKFTGKNSIGFKNGKIYMVSLELYPNGGISIRAKESEFPQYKDLRCEYGNINKFLENWEVQKINEVKNKYEIISGSVGVTGSSVSTGLTGSSSSISLSTKSEEIVGKLKSSMRSVKLNNLLV